MSLTIQEDGEDSPEERGALPESLTAEHGQALLEWGRAALISAVLDQPLPDLVVRAVTPPLLVKQACFVTLMKKEALRGCIGNLIAHKPLCQAVLDNTRLAALCDPRFERVEPRELDSIQIEISVLSEPRPLAWSGPEALLDQLNPLVDGVVLRLGSSVATFLPQVWKTIPDRRRFMEQLARKAGCEASAWCDPEAGISIYQAKTFREADYSLMPQSL
jgi:AmmeMemoRadiSam system protein A